MDANEYTLPLAETLISTTTPLPENRTARCMELLEAAKRS
jgi:hypothetical protein